MTKYSEYIEKMTWTAKEAGKIMLSADYEKLCDSISEKEGTANFVTEYDKSVQKFIFGELSSAFPEAVFIGEEDEGGHPHTSTLGYSFVIDPIDGTTNFIRNLRKSAVSIGLLFARQPVCGAVYDPYSDSMFTAVKGEGAYCNGKRITAASRRMDESIIAFGTSPYYKSELADVTFRIAKSLFMKGADIRRSGSAAIDLCEVASGKTDIMFEARLSPWDYTAGSLILSEAGGKITDFNGNPVSFDNTSSVIAASPSVFEEALLTVKKCIAEI